MVILFAIEKQNIFWNGSFATYGLAAAWRHMVQCNICKDPAGCGDKGPVGPVQQENKQKTKMSWIVMMSCINCLPFFIHLLLLCSPFQMFQVPSVTTWQNAVFKHWEWLAPALAVTGTLFVATPTESGAILTNTICSTWESGICLQDRFKD